ncbi:MAG: MFS transporter [Alphaproteobacteria bacterium]|nr:MFS transporter [Alphaproteobacteria bacterium]
MTVRPAAVGTLGKTTLLFAAVLAPFQAASISPAIPELLAHFADHPNAAYLARLVLVMPSIGIALSAPLAGAVIDRFGRRRFLLWAILAYALLGASGGLVDNLEVLLVTRLFLGFAAGGVMTATVTLMGDYFDGPERQKFLGQRTAFVNFSAIAINISGGFLAAIDWRVPFLVFLVALFLVPIGARSLPEPIISAEAKAAPRLRFREWPLAFIALVYVMVFLVNVAFFFVPTQIPFYVRTLGYEGAQIAGFALASSSLGIALGSLLYHPVRSRVRQAASTFVPAAFLVVAGFSLVASADTLWLVMPGLLLAGSGFGVINVNAIVWSMEGTPAPIRGRMIGGLTAAMMLGHFCSPLISQPIAAAWGLPAVYVFGVGLLGVIGIIFSINAVRPRSPA